MRVYLVLLICCWLFATAAQVQEPGSPSAASAESSPGRDMQAFQRDQLYMESAVQRFRKSISSRSLSQKLRPRSKPSRGILITAGGSIQLSNAFATVKYMREKLHSALAIQLSFWGKEELDKPIVDSIKELGVSLVDVSHAARRTPTTRSLAVDGDGAGYLKKVLSLYLCKFDEVLALDADSCPLITPEAFFSSSSYLTHGNLFFREVWREGVSESPRPEAFLLVGLYPPWHNSSGWASTESGQYMFDRRSHAHVLEWTIFLNSHKDIMYRYVYGDKDLFEMAFMLAGDQHTFNQVKVNPRLALEDSQESHFHLTGEIHNSPENGLPWFFHRVGVNKLIPELDGIHRVDYVTSPIAYKVMEDHLRMEGWFHISKALFDNLPDCMHVDMWTLAFWKELQSRGEVPVAAAYIERCSKAFGHLKQGELPMALLPPDAFGTILTECFSAQFDAIRYLNDQNSHVLS